ncbi:unnamed protein product [Rotaria sordida]|uniref:Carboxylesterase type B domain-containing protein n=1 Tax=Rotaria sordida TaxID=392033 RepID=A0A819LK52_9BILA|nr:unnamed protein product [Rotaria sordida]
MMVSAFFWIALTCCFQIISGNEPAIIHTNLGDIQGYETDMARVFYGIPFAQPPVDTLRWQPSVPVGKWAPQVLNATIPAPACPQSPSCTPSIVCPTIFSEDCLYLNVFTPLLSSLSSTALLPVMIFITGGNFQSYFASGPIYQAERFANTNNVICVFIQYRLGILGFFAIGRGPNDIKGNYGILDQHLTIAWVKANIAAFGGDPDQTLKRFPPDKSGDQRSLLSSIATEWVFVCSTRVFARKTPSYSYVFRYPLDFNAWENMSYCNNHACHAVELPFLFETAWPNTTDTGRWLSKSMATYWTNFAKTQDPNKPEIVRVEWPRTIIGNEKYIYFQNPIQIEANYMKDDCDFWDTIGYKVHDF